MNSRQTENGVPEPKWELPPPPWPLECPPGEAPARVFSWKTPRCPQGEALSDEHLWIDRLSRKGTYSR